VDRLFGSLYLDSGKIQQELGWVPPFSMQDGLNETANWYKGVSFNSVGFEKL
jgi:nucleoside-diphosphate-sugar epimerase